jgi:hypothetical protein
MSLPQEKETKDEVMEEAYRVKYELASAAEFDVLRVGGIARAMQATLGNLVLAPPVAKPE